MRETNDRSSDPSQAGGDVLGRPVSFLATDRPDAAKTFYRDVMGLTLTDASPYALVFDDGGQMLRVQIVETLTPAPFTAHGWQVADIDATVAQLRGKGVTFEAFAHLPQDARGIWTTPDGSQIAWFKDPSGNILSLTQFAPD